MTSYSEYDRGYENGVQDTLDENPPLKWTTEPPTEENGCYCIESKELFDPAFLGKGYWCLGRVFRNVVGELRIWVIGAGMDYNLSIVDRWAGPLRPPPGDEK